MRNHILERIKLLTTFVLLGPLFTTAQSPAVVDVLRDNDNSLILQLNTEEGISRPNKILLVYDSNIIALESSNYHPVNNVSKTYFYSNSMSGNLAFAEEIEKDIEIEDWMLRPFKAEYSQEYLIPQEEEVMAIEPWMTDLAHWKL
jgi:hypothetical protein